MKPLLNESWITLAHGSGGQAMHDLIEGIMTPAFQNVLLDTREDQARIPLSSLTSIGDRLAFTTDSFVVDPLIFPGGDIGSLAVNGTLNDLAMGGAQPLFLSCSLILEEGLPIATLRQIIASMERAAKIAGVAIVTGDTKVVPHGAADQMFINTAGLGVIPAGIDLSSQSLQERDVLVVNGTLGDHGTAILVARGDLALETPIESDCQALQGLVATLLKACPEVHSLRDLTRGGLATILNEWATSSQVGIQIQEINLPIRAQVQGVCEILGLDPLYLANEGKFIAALPAHWAKPALAALQTHPLGKEACLIGQVIAETPGIVRLKTAFGSERILDRLHGEILPRIC